MSGRGVKRPAINPESSVGRYGSNRIMLNHTAMNEFSCCKQAILEGMCMVKAVIFDIDGTLIDSVDAHAASWSEAFGHFGYRVEKSTVRQKIGMGADFLLRDFLNPETIALRGKDIEAYRAELFKKNYLSGVQGFPGVRALFQHIRRRGQIIVLASSCK